MIADAYKGCYITKNNGESVVVYINLWMEMLSEKGQASDNIVLGKVAFLTDGAGYECISICKRMDFELGGTHL